MGMDVEKKMGKVISLYLKGDDIKAKQVLSGVQTRAKQLSGFAEFNEERMENIWRIFKNRPGPPKRNF